MNSLNSILLEGNLVRDPELGSTPKGTPVCKFAIASNRYYKLEDEYQKEVSFFKITTWSKLAEACGAHLKKGRGVRLVGRIKQDRWKGTDGKIRSNVYVIADHIDFKPVFTKEENSAERNDESDALKPAASY